jgi:hypothetical protein
LNKRSAELLEALEAKGFFIASGKDLWQSSSSMCVYLGENYSQHDFLTHGINLHVTANASVRDLPRQNSKEVQQLQAQLLMYRAANHDRVQDSKFNVNGLVPELAAAAKQLAAVIIDDIQLQKQLIDVLGFQSEQARVDRSYSLTAIVLRAVIAYCHEPERQEVFVRDITVRVISMSAEDGEVLKISNEKIGHVLRSLGLYTRRLGSKGRGLLIDKALRSRAHNLARDNEILNESASDVGCGFCHDLQTHQSELI